MEDKSHMPFPYKCRELKPAEKELVTEIFKSPNIDYVRVGPKGYIVNRNYPRDAQNIYNMPLRADDIFVSSYPRSGTTWTQEMVWLLANNLDYATAAEKLIARRYTFLDRFMFFTDVVKEDLEKTLENTEFKENALKTLDVLSTPVADVVATMSSPRFLKTHLPLSLLPPLLLDTVKVVYIARDPRDVAVSFYHFTKLFEIFHKINRNFKDYWNLFTKDLIIYAPYFEHVKEAWDKRHHPNMLFLFYEELLENLPAGISRVANFLGKKLTEGQIDHLCDHLSFNNFKKCQSLNHEYLKETLICSPEETFIRKGIAGGWRDYFDEEMMEQAERWIQHNLRDTDLRFPHLNVD